MRTVEHLPIAIDGDRIAAKAEDAHGLEEIARGDQIAAYWLVGARPLGDVPDVEIGGLGCIPSFTPRAKQPALHHQIETVRREQLQRVDYVRL